MPEVEKDVWRAVLASALDAIIVMDQEGLVRQFNPAAEATFGRSRDSVLGRPLADVIIPPRLREAHRQGLARYLETGNGPVLGKRIEVSAMHESGREFPVELAIVPFESDGEQLFAGYLRDLTARVAADRQLHRRLRTIQLLYQVPLLADQATTSEEAARLCLDRVCEFTGWPVGHAYFVSDDGATLESRGVWHVPSGQHFEEFRRITSATRFSPGVGLPGLVWQRGKPVWMRDVQKEPNFPRARHAADIKVHGGFGFPVKAADKVWAVLEFFSETSEEPDEELLSVAGAIGLHLGRIIELREANVRLRAVDAERRRFLNAAAHELGTPLTPIILQLEVVRSQFGDTATVSQRRSIGILSRNVTRLQHLVADLLDSARIQSQRFKLHLEAFDVADEVALAVDAHRELAQGQAVRLLFQRSEPCPLVADRARIAQVLDNLLSNAIKFSPNADAELTCRCAPGGAHVTVKDNGIGFPSDAATRLFRPFSQLNDNAAHRGTGLGLYICKGIIDAHGGEIGATSEGPGHGATFWFSIPSQPLSDDALEN